MKELEIEALNDAIFKQSETFIPDDAELQAHIKGFIAGATSSYVEQEKIKFAISVLNLQKINTNKDGLMYIEADKVLNVIKELEQKLLEK